MYNSSVFFLPILTKLVNLDQWAVGEQEAIDQSVDLLAPGGLLVLVGIPEVDRISFNIDQLRRKEIRVQNDRRHVTGRGRTSATIPKPPSPEW